MSGRMARTTIADGFHILPGMGNCLAAETDAGKSAVRASGVPLGAPGWTTAGGAELIVFLGFGSCGIRSRTGHVSRTPACVEEMARYPTRWPPLCAYGATSEPLGVDTYRRVSAQRLRLPLAHGLRGNNERPHGPHHHR